MRLLTIATFLSSLFCFQAFDCDQAVAQQVRKSGGDCAVNYQPSDPWKRGRWFNIQTGNSGLFYNCDGEQAKRNSPYICWKPDDEPMLPPLVAPWTIWRQQMDEVRQRVANGSCCDLGCSCADCRKARRAGQQAGCAACVQTASNQSRMAQSDSVQSAVVTTTSPIEPAVAQADHGTKYGLVQGKTIDPVTTQHMEAPVLPSIKQSSVAKKSLMDHLRRTKRR